MNKNELFGLFDELASDMGYWYGISEAKFDELAEKILTLNEPDIINWEEIDPVKWRGLNGESNQHREITN